MRWFNDCSEMAYFLFGHPVYRHNDTARADTRGDRGN